MTAGKPLEVVLVAGEESGDRLGAALIRAIKAERGDTVRVSGVGGTQMAKEGVQSLFPLSDLALIGFVAVFRKLPSILEHIRRTADAVIAADPDILVIIDSPEFTHRVAKRVRRARPALPIVDYVSPSVWAWRPWRARAMRRYVDHVLALLPFEPGAHERLGGPPCTYVGHPLCERVAELRPNPEEARRRLADPPFILVLPGSRGGEIRRLLAPFGAAIERVVAARGPVDLVLPTVPHLHATVSATVAHWPVPPRVIVDQREKDAAFRTARAALAASGTVTLELAIAGVPTVAAYRVTKFDEYVARRLIRVHSILLPNLVLGENVVPEFIQDECTPEALASALTAVIEDTPERRRQIEAFSRLDSLMQVGTPVPSARAARIVLDMADARRRG